MRILYLGVQEGPVSIAARSGALRRLGHEVHAIDPRNAMPAATLLDWWIFHTGGLGFGRIVENYILRETRGKTYDLAFVDVGELVGGSLVRQLKTIARKVVCYNHDNPFVPRDGGRWRLFKDALPYYDLLAVRRDSSIEPAYRHGAQDVVRVWCQADEELFRPLDLSPEDLRKYGSDVAFIGTWMPERGPFMRRLVELGMPLRIFGPRWQKAEDYAFLAPHITLGPLMGPEYAKAIAGSKISLALLSKGNEDLHTSRSSEIPAVGRVLCGERTSEHLAMYEEGEEAIFFDSAEECTQKCLELLADPERLERIAAAGHRRVHKNGTFSGPQLQIILDAAMKKQ